MSVCLETLANTILAQVEFALSFLDKIQREGVKSAVVSGQANTEFNDYKDEVMGLLAFSGDCNSWYKGGTATGRIVGPWPGSVNHFLESVRNPRLQDFEFEYVTPTNRFAYLGRGLVVFSVYGYLTAIGVNHTMAHIFELAESLSSPTGQSPLYTNGIHNPSTPSNKIPPTETFSGFNRLSRIEADLHDLEITGLIPADIDGTFFRIQPDHRFAPVYESDIHFNGDGNVTAIRIAAGRAHFRQRYVHTDRYDYESRENEALFGKYRNPYTDNEAVKGVIRTAANTNVVFWRRMLLATKEDGPAWAMGPETLETIGRYDFEGQVLSLTMTAHPKFDAKRGKMVCYGYEAGGDGNDRSRDIVVYTINSEGVKTEECWYKAPGRWRERNDRFTTKKYNHYWQCAIDDAKPYDFPKCGSPAGGLFNRLGRFTWDGTTTETLWAGPCATFQEPAFIPRAGSNEEGDGYLVVLLNHLDELRNDILILDAKNIAQGPVAVIHLPFKLRLGLHGNFVDQSEITAWKGKREKELGPVEAAREPLPWQKKEEILDDRYLPTTITAITSAAVPVPYPAAGDDAGAPAVPADSPPSNTKKNEEDAWMSSSMREERVWEACMQPRICRAASPPGMQFMDIWV
ncbi:retinal pigment epithelial membrane protein-domain-containing protein [Bombardia bombarda]|uniref:Retinal pigment epithelial membrane protein-domain-containing protein n=1 Tax=Bombardia bombarda TaxID=252184 RepID=A0AA39XNL9_9PEZI|nr:retinal pigment epithelial membrane protein-domain-containing protein [Bombardia bombarda]